MNDRAQRDNELSSDLVLELMGRLVSALDQRGVEASIYIVGGAAIALDYDSRRLTVDVDAFFEPRDIVLEEAKKLAEEFGISDDWLNDKAKMGKVNADDEGIPQMMSSSGVKITTASPHHLIAMKLAAERDRDVNDIATILEETGINPTEAIDIAHDLYGEGAMYLQDRGESDIVMDEALRIMAKRRKLREGSLPLNGRLPSSGSGALCGAPVASNNNAPCIRSVHAGSDHRSR